MSKGRSRNERSICYLEEMMLMQRSQIGFWCLVALERLWAVFVWCQTNQDCPEGQAVWKTVASRGLNALKGSSQRPIVL